MSLLRVENLSKTFRRFRLGRAPVVRTAVQSISFSLDKSETLALVGESGAGKSTVGRLVLRLIEPDEGEITLDGVDVRGLRRAELKRFRQRAQMVFQDPHSTLNPRIPIAKSVREPLDLHRIGTRAEREERTRDLLSKVGIGSHLHNRLPSQLSGGQLQRASIARALTTQPELIVCDEPTSALDMSIQAQVINLLQDVQEEFGVAYLFVTHDLALVESVADNVIVMRQGELVERGTTSEVFARPQQDYTRKLLDAIPYVPTR